MKKNITLVVLLISITQLVIAQTKVFREVSEEISSQISTITQDNALVGYLVFTELEKASADSFNYKITILDENLNDIGTLNFRHEKLYLKAVSFEQDVLCIAYLKTNFLHKEFKNRKEFQSELPKAKNSFMLQFVGLDGHIIQYSNVKLDLKTDVVGYQPKMMPTAKLKNELQLKNISQKGFVMAYGDDSKNNVLTYDLRGSQTWEKTIKSDLQGINLVTSNHNVYVLTKENDPMYEGGYELLGFNTDDNTSYPKYVLKDKNGNSLKVLSFGNEPNSGKPYLAGTILDAKKGNKSSTVKELAKGPYSGVFNLSVDNSKVSESFSYWADGSQDFVTKRGYYPETKSYAKYRSAFKDYNGNTYYVGTAFSKKANWAIIVPSVITAPLILPPIYLLAAGGTQKGKVKDAVLIKQDQKGKLSFQQSIQANRGSSFQARFPLSMFDNRKHYCVTNSDTKSTFLVIDDWSDIFIYNVNQNKLQRTIPHKDGNVRTAIFPAKEGHVLISEYNKKERYTRFSIEAL